MSASAPIEERVRALKGLTIGTNPVGATYYQMLRSYLKQYGLNPDKDVRLVAIADSSALISGLDKGRLDAIASASGIVEQAIAHKTGTMWFSAARGDLPDSRSPLVCVIVTRSETLLRQRRDVGALRAALSDALDTVRNDHEATGRMLKAAYFQTLDQAVWDLAWNAATHAYPASLAFPRDAYEYWIENDPKGPESFRNVDYTQITYGPAQSS